MFDSNFLILGVGYQKRSGKDTMANYLVENHGFVRMSFADPLKEACRIIYLLNDEQLYGDLKEVIDPRWGKTPRELMQLTGTEAIRDQVDDKVWIKNLEYRVAEYAATNPNGRVVVPDMRFINEIYCIKDMGGYAGKINRPDVEINDFSQHQSELELKLFTGFDFKLDNSGTLQDFYNNIEQFMRRFK
jgi:hypothetical protein